MQRKHIDNCHNVVPFVSVGKQPELLEIVRFFQELDRNRTGYIRKDQLKRCLIKANRQSIKPIIEHLLHQLDADEDGRVCFIKYYKCMSKILSNVHKSTDESSTKKKNESFLTKKPSSKRSNLLQIQVVLHPTEDVKTRSVSINYDPSRRSCFSSSMRKDLVDGIYTTIKNHPLYHWHEAHGDAICAYRAVLMRAMGETICSEIPGASGALAYISFIGLQGSPRSSSKMNRPDYYASLYRPFYMETSNGFRVPFRRNMISLLDSIRIPHVALCVNIDDKGPMVIDPAYAINSSSDGPFTIEDWIKQHNDYNNFGEHVEHGYVAIQSEWFPWTMSHLYLLSGGEALLSSDFMTMPTLAHVINVLTMYRLMLAENQSPTDRTPSPDEVDVYFKAFAIRHDQKEEMAHYMNNVEQYVKELGENFPTPGPAPLLPPPEPVYVILNNGMSTRISSTSANERHNSQRD
ncbi:unnamed protein product [Adineta ricciae]|uniref:EF-hand domain-containing protein n=2 Tax=Adineta ricciae TaxID=249248 RepID=A0A814F7I4_ADIRI|nr:unnamed protein product [Adineta ricciae]